MLSAGDRLLVDRDPALAGLAHLLDDEAFATLARRHLPELGVSSARGRYIRYKPATSCLIAYDVETACGPRSIYARGHPAGPSEKLEKVALRRDEVPDSRLAIDEPLGVVLYVFPTDHELKGLAHLAGEADRRALWQRLIPTHPALHGGELEILRYKPERRCVARLRTPGVTDGPSDIVVRFYTGDDFIAAKDASDAFHDTEHLTLASRVGRCKRDRTTAMTWIAGRTFCEGLGGEMPDEATARAIGAAIGDLHRQRPKKLKSNWTAEEFAATLTGAATLLGGLHEPLAEPARRVAEHLEAKICGRIFRAHRSIHGDLTSEQIILGGDNVGLIDLDRAGYGDPRIDIGTLTACVRLASGEAADELIGSILDGYRSTSVKDVTRKFERFEAAALLRRGILPFRQRDPDWVNHATRCVDAAARQLDLPAGLPS